MAEKVESWRRGSALGALAFAWLVVLGVFFQGSAAVSGEEEQTDVVFLEHPIDEAIQVPFCVDAADVDGPRAGGDLAVCERRVGRHPDRRVEDDDGDIERLRINGLASRCVRGPRPRSTRALIARVRRLHGPR